MQENTDESNKDKLQPLPGMHVSNRKTEKVCRDGKIIVQNWVRYSPPLTDWILESETKTDESC